MIHHHQQQQSQTSSASSAAATPLSSPSPSPSLSPYSFCVLWSPLHPITAFFPFIGHLGISDSTGRSHDFQGPYYVGSDQSYPLPRMAFGYPTRYLQLQLPIDNGGEWIVAETRNKADTATISERWDEAIQEANGIYQQRMHNICCDNCHSHVAKALNIMQYKGRHDWDMIKLCFLLFFYGSFVPSPAGGNGNNSNTTSCMSSILLQFGPFLVIVSFIILLSSGIVF